MNYTTLVACTTMKRQLPSSRTIAMVAVVCTVLVQTVRNIAVFSSFLSIAIEQSTSVGIRANVETMRNDQNNLSAAASLRTKSMRAGDVAEECLSFIDGTFSTPNVTIPYAKDLQDSKLCHSFQHQYKFLSVRSSVLSWIKNHKRQNHLLFTSSSKHFSFILNKDFAFRHIFKSGGTTIASQTHSKNHVGREELGNRSLLATVRDPIDHFLSGWSECGYRHFNEMINLTVSEDASYDDRVRAWLLFMKTDDSNESTKKLKGCSKHSFPQANYLFLYNSEKEEFEWDSKVAIVGDLSELSGLLNMIGFQYNAAIKQGRRASDNKMKVEAFPSNKTLLSTQTIQDICRYVALDYYVFNFDPPSPCYEELMANMAEMNIIN